MSSKKSRIFIVDDHAVVRMGLSLIIRKAKDFEVCGESADGQPVIGLISKLTPDALILDLNLKDIDGLELLKEIHAKFPRLPVLVLSMNEQMVYAERTLRAGALAYLNKEDALEKVVTALRKIIAGEIYADERVQAKLLRKVARAKPGEIDPVSERLSDRELDVFRLLGQGFTARAISERWNRSVKTVETYRANIKQKLDLKSTAELIREAVEWEAKNKG